MSVLPLWKSHYSIGRSILTLEKAGSSKPTEPSSIIDLCLKYKLKKAVLVEDSFSGFLEAYSNFKDAGISLVFGLRTTITEDLSVKSEESLKNQHKVIIFPKNTDGYKKLIKISTKAQTDGFYYEPRLDYSFLSKVWNEAELSIGIPFYDSFIFNNLILGAHCVPRFDFCAPTFFLEENFLPFDVIVRKTIINYVGNDFETTEAKSIYYANREDFKAYQTFRCINNRSTLETPNLESCSSPEFCAESWSECNSLKCLTSTNN
jgi:DNA polymerase-3 subunit alpha